MNVIRNLNGVKHPLSDRAHGIIVSKVEERFSHALFFPTAPVIEVIEVIPAAVVEVVSTVVAHDTECRCNVCLNAMLDGILARSEASLKTLTESVNAQTA